MINFKNTEIAFGSKTNTQLRKAHLLFSLMNKAWLVNMGSNIGLWAMRVGLPIAPIVRYTMFEQFCGGTSLSECQSTVEHLDKYRALTVLDYGAEAKETEVDYDFTTAEQLRAIELAAKNIGKIPVITCKFTALAAFSTLEKLQNGEPLDATETANFAKAKQRLKDICQYAFDKKVAVFIDAEESWIQNPIDAVAEAMMAQFNTSRVTVYNTYQMYLQSRLPYLRESFVRAEEKGYLLGAKLVRGAYMQKERKRADEMGYASPVQPDKAATDRDYDAALAFCVQNYKKIGSCAATHNEKSTALQVELMEKNTIPNNHAHLNFCQLYGMSDHLTFNLANTGYNAAKYLVYGEVHDVFPYLVRRAQENSSITGDMSRELSFLTAEVKRRGL